MENSKPVVDLIMTQNQLIREKCNSTKNTQLQLLCLSTEIKIEKTKCPLKQVQLIQLFWREYRTFRENGRTFKKLSISIKGQGSYLRNSDGRKEITKRIHQELQKLGQMSEDLLTIDITFIKHQTRE